MAGPNLVLGDVIHITGEGILFGQRTINDFYYVKTVTDDVVSLSDMLDNWITVNGDQILPPVTSTDWEFFRGTADLIFPVNRRSAQVVSTQEMRDGQIAGGSLPPSTTVVVARRTSIRGPSGRGRMFFPAVPTNWHDDGFLAAAGVTAYNGILADLALPISVAGNEFQPCLYHRLPAGFDVVEYWTFDRVLRQQRRREIGIGI